MQLARKRNEAAAEMSGGHTIHRQFAAQAAATPSATAVVCRGRSLTYAEVDRRARALARRLRRLGVGPEAVVAVLAERSLELPVALLGILEAGGAYLPLDPANPPGRLAQLLAAARPTAVVAHRSLARRLPPRVAPVLVLEDADADSAETANPADRASSAGLPADQADQANPVRPAGRPAGPQAPATAADRTADAGSWQEAVADNLACVLHGSGSGGAPRAVMVSHGNVAGFFSALDRYLGAGAGGTWLAASGASDVSDAAFDGSGLELLWTLCRGWRVVLHDEPERTLETTAVAPGSTSAPRREIAFSLFFFGSYAAGRAADHYRLVLEGARFADRHEFSAIWTPERHFHEFGGLFPNPSVLSAAIAAGTERLQIRAGSVVLPLHDPLRVAEEWALVDNLSGGRVGVSFASGWHANDFVLNPGAYQDRQEVMRRGIDAVRRLWRGEALRLPSGAGAEVEVRIFPRPVQPELPVWVTAAGSPATFQLAGELGAGVLTHLLGHEEAELAAKIRVYRDAWSQSGHVSGGGRVTVMLHTFVGASREAVEAAVREPLSAYLKTSFGLLRSLAESAGLKQDPRQLPPGELDLLVARAYQRYVAAGAGLIGTPDSCAATVERLRQLGVDEVACLIDFGVPAEQVLASLTHLDELRRRTAASGQPRVSPGEASPAVAELIARHGVTHLQCMPALASRLVADLHSAAALGGLRGLLVAGREPLPPALARQLAGLGDLEVHSLYGRTETTGWSSAGLVRDGSDGTQPGTPLAHAELHVLDRELHPAPPEALGEICVGGGGVARGYLGRADLTAERFVPDPCSGRPGARLFRTGDLVPAPSLAVTPA
jgi:natural product biosynthesis luciferase-like monooxygenase protein